MSGATGILLASALAAAAVLIRWPARGRSRVRCTSANSRVERGAWPRGQGWAGGVRDRRGRDGQPGPGSSRLRVIIVPAAGGTLALLVTGSLALAAAAAGATVVGVAAHARRCRWARAAELRELVIEFCRATAAELRAGRPPDAALHAALASLLPTLGPGAERLSAPDAEGRRRAAAEDLRPLLRTPAAHVPAELRRCGRNPGGAGLTRIAVCWDVATVTGAGLAVALDRVADGLDADEVVRREVTAQLAGPRATAWLLSGLPVVGLLLGAGLGADPVGMLLGTPVGLMCLVTGAALTVTGVLWTSHLARAAEPP